MTDDLFTYPNAPGYKAEGTSKAAAKAVAKDAKKLAQACLECLKAWGPATSDEVAEELGESILAVRPRMSELYAKSKIVNTGNTRRNASGKSATVWGLNPFNA